MSQPLYDWTVDVLVVSENAVYPVTVYDVTNLAEAEWEALASFFPDAGDLKIVKAERQP